MEKFESAIRQIERLLKVRILAYLVLQISDERDEVRLHRLNLIRSGLLGLPQRGAGVGGLGVAADFIPSLTCRLRLAWLAGDVANHRQHGRPLQLVVRPRIVVRRTNCRRSLDSVPLLHLQMPAPRRPLP